ncbi:MAG: hypothetical protein WB507_06465 [Solirubrobacterales bacterium]
MRGIGSVVFTAFLLALVGAATVQAGTSQRGSLRVAFDGTLTPHSLPRSGGAPVTVSVVGRISNSEGAKVPQLRRVSIAINRFGRLSSRGLARCTEKQIQPATTVEALKACGSALVGEGSFTSNVLLPAQAPFPSLGKVVAFNGTYHGHQAILAHVYGTQPIPTSYVLPFLITHTYGTFATALSAALPQVTGEWGYVTGMKLTLGRRFSYRGQPHSYLSATCPAPAGFPGASFPLARANFGFSGNVDITNTLTRSCRVSGH